MPVLFELLGKYWKEVAIALVVLALVGRFCYLEREVHADEAKIVVYESQVHTLEGANATLSGSINTQNQAITALADASKNQANAFITLGQTLSTQQSQLNSQVASVLAGPKPTTCTDAISYLNAFGGSLNATP